MPELIVLAGSNGAGKSTFYDSYLARLNLPFVNADIFAKALNPNDPAAVNYVAAQQADQQRRAYLMARTSFVMETVFSDPAGDKIAFLREAQAMGFRVTLIFIGIDSPALSQARVIGRVAHGGHDVPDDRLIERFPRTLANLKVALKFVDRASLFDNSSARSPYRPIATVEDGQCIVRYPPLPGWANAALKSLTTK